MATIEPRRETVVKETYMIFFESREELQGMLDDPKSFFREVRAVLRQGNGTEPKARLNGPSRRTGGRRKMDARKKRSGMTGRVKRADVGGGQECPKCHQVFKRLGNHVNHCDGMDIGQIAVSVD